MKLPLESITVGERRREDFGDIAGLAESIQKLGLFHPIVVDSGGKLVAGERRLRAVQSLGWETIEVKDLGELTDAERDEIELEENLQRKDLTPYERSKTLARLAQTAKTVLRQEAELRTDSVQNSPGRPQIPDSSRAVAERIGRPAQTIREAERHVETADQFPELQAPGWKPYHVLEAREKLDRLPEPERPKAVALIAQPGIPPKDGIEILGNLTTMPDEQRGRVFDLNESDDSRDRSLALTTAADKPPMPDPRIHILVGVANTLRKAEKAVPPDEMTGRIKMARLETDSIAKELREGYDRDRRA